MEDNSKEDVIGEIGIAVEHDTAHNTSVSLADNFVEDWFRDASKEAEIKDDYNARRREIVFSMIFVECFLLEWTRRKVEVEEFDDYYPPNPKRPPSIDKKWRAIPMQLKRNNKISRDPRLDTSQLEKLADYRNGLIHSRASRHQTTPPISDVEPFPTKEKLKAIEPGWAVGIVSDLVLELCKTLDEPIPDYLK